MASGDIVQVRVSYTIGANIVGVANFGAKTFRILRWEIVSSSAAVVSASTTATFSLVRYVGAYAAGLDVQVPFTTVSPVVHLLGAGGEGLIAGYAGTSYPASYTTIDRMDYSVNSPEYTGNVETLAAAGVCTREFYVDDETTSPQIANDQGFLIFSTAGTPTGLVADFSLTLEEV